jgi:hypothetical protein
MYTLVANGDVPSSTYFNGVMKQTVIVCTSGTRPSSPPAGMVVFETDTGQLKVYDGAAWRRTGAFDQETYGYNSNADSTSLTGIVSTTFIAGSPACGFTFKAPPSGAVYVTVSGTVRMANNGNETRLTYALRTGTTVGSGTVVVAASSLRGVVCGQAVVTSGPSMASASFRHPHTGLTAGADYNIRTEHNVSGGSGQIDYRMVSIEPLL